MIDVIREKGAAFTSSFEEEFYTARSAINWICQNPDFDENCTVVIVTNSQSWCAAQKGVGEG